MDVNNLTDLIRNHNLKKKSFSKIKMGGQSFIRHVRNGNTYFEYDEHPYEKECELKAFMNEQIKYMNFLLAKELEMRKHDAKTCD